MYKIKFLLIMILIIGQGCDTTEPTGDDKKPGKRNYAWTVDSVNSPGFPYLKSIWGSDPENVWGAGFSEDVRDCLWHYDGISWKRAAEGTPITTSGNGSPIVGGVWGTAQDDVWAFGGRRFSSPERSESFIMHFNGTSWEEVYGNKENMPEGFRDIYPINKDHFWISSAPNVYEYNTGIWKKYFIGENFVIQSIEGIENDVYITAYQIGLDSLYIMKFESDNFLVVDQTNLLNNGKFAPNGLIIINNEMYTFGWEGIYSAKMSKEKVISDSWEQIVLTNNGGFSNSFLLSGNDIWAVGTNHFPYHFNGSSWHPIELRAEGYFFGIWGDGNEIFICDIENGKIYHGM